jgi:hypothetical protein
MKNTPKVATGKTSRETNTTGPGRNRSGSAVFRRRRGVPAGWLFAAVILPAHASQSAGENTPAGGRMRGGKRSLKISPLKCLRYAPILEGGTASGGRKLPEGKPGGRLYQSPPHGKDAVQQ